VASNHCFLRHVLRISAGQQQPDSNQLSADQIIRILQANPELLADAKTKIQIAARDSGYPVNQSDITDDRVFSKVRSDDQFRLALSTELEERDLVRNLPKISLKLTVQEKN